VPIREADSLVDRHRITRRPHGGDLGCARAQHAVEREEVGGDPVEEVLERAAGFALAAATPDLTGKRPDTTLGGGYAGGFHVVVGVVLEMPVRGMTETL
jgi:hypothetical protein